MRFTMSCDVKRFSFAVAVICVTSGAAGRVQADVAYSQTFDSRSATYSTNDPYWLENAGNGFPNNDNGLIITAATNFPTDVSGSGYFLFTGTGLYNGNLTIPAGQDQFFISPTFSVVPIAVYSISFYLANADLIAPASIQPEIAGTLLGSAVSNAGFGWVHYTFTWNSGSNTTASLILHDYQQAAVGNDFGVDSILVSTSIPEPSSAILLVIGAVGFAGYGWRRRKIVAA
jgi:PEP-CTERM motif